ncbi:multi antimicrobial extrusion protein [Vibrio sp. JCM 19236]|nr:multi antimicrobial extrusion protein [Vibrio sp. JCM 19236]
MYWLMSAMLYVCIKTHRQYKSLIDFSDAKPEPKEMLSLFKLGLPIGTNIAVCGSIFAVIALLIGRIGAENVAAAQIALNISSMTYVISMSVSFGITIRVGHALGANNTIGAVERSKIGIMVAGLISLIPATVLLNFPDPIISYTPQTLWLAQLRRDFLFSPLCINLAMPCKPLPMAPYVVTKIPRFLCSYLWPVIGD